MKDAPYITDAERHGMPHARFAKCPNCGQKAETIYAIGPEAFGCEHCVDVMDADVWVEEGGEEY